MRRMALIFGLVLAPVGWALSRYGMTGHMAGHMIAVAVAAPLLALATTGTRADPALRWPRVVTPMAMMLLELLTVWSWHLPALRAAADASPVLPALEHLSFLAAGFLLWSAALHAPARASGIGALLLTSMHMTLLGVLIGLAPRPLYHGMHHSGGLDPLADQQLGGVVMLVVGGVSYLVGGLALLGTLLRGERSASA
ncbi:cytochrome c oxidase assembly protein [Novosphingobium kaempferiae]|uniref:cytochrome c oxidase assembly protein n=1 Tax=Novosphingobium kaempferiae TaxID=2896849 RepID=UPI001E47A731|nr:cytochrome c oxidase assembly protein [Novosphingobium kaempferiae]